MTTISSDIGSPRRGELPGEPGQRNRGGAGSLRGGLPRRPHASKTLDPGIIRLLWGLSSGRAHTAGPGTCPTRVVHVRRISPISPGLRLPVQSPPHFPGHKRGGGSRNLGSCWETTGETMPAARGRWGNSLCTLIILVSMSKPTPCMVPMLVRPASIDVIDACRDHALPGRIDSAPSPLKRASPCVLETSGRS